MNPARIIGIVIGLLCAGVVIERRSPGDVVTRRMISECDGALSELVIHYVSGDQTAWPVYRDFLRQLPPDVLVDVVCPDRAAYDELIERVGPVRCRLSPILCGHRMTVWSRDRWVALTPDASERRTTLLTPRDELGVEQWPARAGDSQVAFDLQKSLAGDVIAEKLSIDFDGGDLLADDRNVFVTPAVPRRNVQRTVNNVNELVEMLQRRLGKRVVLLEAAPDHHAGMYMMAVGNRTMLVGDPGWGRRILGTDLPLDLPGGADLSAGTQDVFDAVVRQVTNVGYRVVRIPTIVSPDAKTYLTYVNVITDHRDHEDIVYLPTYKGVEKLNDAAAEVWRGLGYAVRPVDCTSSFKSFGNLHCLVNVLKRNSPTPATSSPPHPAP